MRVKVKLYGDFLKYGPPESYITLPEGATVKMLLEKLRIEEKSYIMILVNLKRSWFETKLKDNDEMSIFAPVGGG